MNNYIGVINDMLSDIHNEEVEFLEQFGGEYESLEEIPDEELLEIAAEGKYGWQTIRDERYLEEKKGLISTLKEKIDIIQGEADPKEKHRARKELEMHIKDARNFKRDKEKSIAAAQEVIDLANKFIEIAKDIIGKKL